MKEHKQSKRVASTDSEAGGHGQGRREFMRLALAALPATGVLAGCATGADATLDGPTDEPAIAIAREAVLGDCPEGGESQARRSRWLQLHAAYIGAENLHDLPGIVASFGS